MQRGRGAASPVPTAEPWKRLETTVAWDELVLPQASLHQLRQLPARFAELFWTASETAVGAGSGKRGLLVLLTGPRGSGKTLAVQALGTELRLSVLAADVERWLARGRTQTMQLAARMFAAAQQLGAVLMLDRCDVLMYGGGNGGPPGTATLTPRDLRDMVARSEAHPGVVVFAVSDTHGVPAAMLQRFDAVIDLPLPDRSAREELWRRSLRGRGSAADIAFLAQTFALPGKAITALGAQAVSDAARDGNELRLEHMAAALERESTAHADAADMPAALDQLQRRVAGPPTTSDSNGRADTQPASPGPPSVGTAAPDETAERAPWEEVAAASHTWDATTTAPEPAADEAPAPAPEPVAAREPAAASEPVAAPTAGPPVRARRSASRLRILPVLILGAAAAVALGLTASKHRGTTPPPAVFNRTAASGPLRLTYPSSWRPVSPPALPGLKLHHALALSSSVPPRGQLVIGTHSGGSSSPLPTRFISSAMPGTPTPQLVTLGGHRFYRVLDPRLALGSASQSVYALPAGAATVIAVCRTASSAFTASCEHALSTLVVASMKAPPSHTNLAYARRLNAVLTKLDGVRSRGGRQLAAARTSSAQAQAAAALASAHAQAASGVARLRAGSAAADNRALAAALHQTADAYAALSHAAARDDARAYAAAQKAVSTGNAAVAAALGRLKAVGYRVR